MTRYGGCTSEREKKGNMAERKPCVRCERPIDAYARSCVYCSWDQATPRPVETAATTAAPAYTPPPDTRIRNRLLGAAAFVALVIIAFVVGSLVHSDPNEAKAAQTTAHLSSPAAADSRSRTTVTLVPVDSDGSAQYESPVTTAPAQSPSAGNVEVNGDRTDATALPSDAYSAAAQRAKAERDVRTNKGVIDPRTIAGSVEPRSERATPSSDARPAPIRAASVPHTEPIPLYQPVPPMRVDRPTNARLILTVGSEGRVRDISIAQSIPDEMPRLIAAVQSWRFKPATQNGHPVTSSFAVDITVHPR
jgi:TonB family protein